MPKKSVLLLSLGLVLALSAWLLLRPALSSDGGAPGSGPAPEGRAEPTPAATASRAASHREPASPPGDGSRSGGADGGSAGGTSLLVRLRWSDGGPADGIGVSVAAEAGGDPFLEEAARLSDGSGEVRFAQLEPGPVLIRADRGDSRRATIRSGEETVVTFDLASGTCVEGRVLDAGGAFVPGSSIWLSVGASEAAKWTGSVVATSDAAGAFTLRDLCGERWIGARAAGHAPSWIHRVLCEDGKGAKRLRLELTLVLPGPGASLRGRVVDAKDLGIAGARVRIGAAYGLALDTNPPARDRDRPPPVALETDADGRFACSGLPPGTERVLARKGGSAPCAELVHLKPGETAELTLVLRQGTAVRGVVRDPQGKPIAAVGVVAYGRARYEEAQAVTSARGEFRFEDLAGELIRLQAQKTGWQPAQATLRADATRELRWDPVLVPVLGLRGRLVDEKKKPLPRWSLFLVLSDDPASGADRLSARTDGEGRFHISPCKEVSYCVYAGLHEDRIETSLRCSPLVRPGPQEVEVVVPDARPSGHFLGMLLDPEGAPAGGAAIQVVQKGGFRFAASTRTEAGSGSFRVGPLPEGAYELILNIGARDLPRLHVKGLALAAAEEKHLGVLRLPGFGQLSVHARFEDGTAPKQVFAEISQEGSDSDPEWLDVSSGAKALPVGRYLVRVYGTGFAWQESSCAIEVRKETRLEYVLERGVQRQLVFPVPEPPGWESVQRFRVEVRRADGGVVIKETFVEEDLWPFTWWPTLTPGRYRMKLWADDRAAVQGEFTVESLARALEPIRIRLD